LSVFRKLLFLVVALLLAAAIIVVPIIVIIAPLAQWVFFALSMCGLIVLHAYMYTLYRELLNEAG
jgi:bacteriorhodopsin